MSRLIPAFKEFWKSFAGKITTIFALLWIPVAILCPLALVSSIGELFLVVMVILPLTLGLAVGLLILLFFATKELEEALERLADRYERNNWGK